MPRQLSIIALLALAACGGTAAPTNGVDSCAITLSGGATASVTQDCVPSAAIAAGGKLSFTVSPEGTSSFGTLSFLVELPGTSFSTGKYDATSVTTSDTVLNDPAGSSSLWEENSGASGSDNAGTFSLNITSTGTQVSNNGDTAWVGCHGSLDATLPPATGNASTSSVTVHIGF